MHCVLPKGHDGPHQASIALPADVGQMIEEHVTELERETRRMKRTRRWMMVLAVVNLLVGIYGLLAIVIRS